MRSTVQDSLPATLRRTLGKLGDDISVARRKRSLTAAMVAERAGVSRSTYLKVERGDPSVAMGTYAMVLFVLGLDGPLGRLADPALDDQGLVLDAQRLPRRVRVPKA